MAIKTTDFNSSEETPEVEDEKTGLCILPDNFYSEPDPKKHFHSANLPTLLKVANGKVQFNIVNQSESSKYIELRSQEWFAPILFIGSAYYSQNPDAISVALGLITNYLTNIFSGRKGTQVNLTMYLRDEKKRRTTKVEFKGPPNELEEVKKIIKDFFGS
jgi:hypothetical protein